MPKDGEKRRGPGQPPHQPTAKSRELVQVLKANRNTLEVIAMAVGISDVTLLKYYRKELDEGAERVRSMVEAAVVKSALSGNVGAQRFWLWGHGGPEWRMQREENDTAFANGGGQTTIIVRGGLASVQQEPPKPNGHDTDSGNIENAD